MLSNDLLRHLYFIVVCLLQLFVQSTIKVFIEHPTFNRYQHLLDWRKWSSFSTEQHSNVFRWLTWVSVLIINRSGQATTLLYKFYGGFDTVWKQKWSKVKVGYRWSLLIVTIERNIWVFSYLSLECQLLILPSLIA